MGRLAGKVAFITGGGTGIGRATVVLFAQKWAKVVVAEINVAAGEETAYRAGNEALDKLAQSHLPGLIEPTDIADMARFQASDQSHMVTGRVYPVDCCVTIS